MTSRPAVAVITGGAGGMGLATAKILGRECRLALADASTDKLNAAQTLLQSEGFDVEVVECDVSNRRSVTSLLQTASAIGQVRSLVHTAGISPNMADAETIIRVNALGTVNVTEAFLDVATEGSRLVNVASMGAYVLPSPFVPRRAFRSALTDGERMAAKLVRRINVVPKAQRSMLAYPLSKQFVIWYSREMAAVLGKKGAGIVSVSPGTIDTEMGRLEENHGAGDMLRFAALKRMGRPEEIAEVLAFCASDKASYLTGTDILCDGGTIAGVRWRDLRSVAH